jgi:hypothetical protein
VCVDAKLFKGVSRQFDHRSGVLQVTLLAVWDLKFSAAETPAKKRKKRTDQDRRSTYTGQFVQRLASSAGTGPGIAEGVGAMIMELRRNFPAARILLLAIFPRGVPSIRCVTGSPR